MKNIILLLKEPKLAFIPFKKGGFGKRLRGILPQKILIAVMIAVWGGRLCYYALPDIVHGSSWAKCFALNPSTAMLFHYNALSTT